MLTKKTVIDQITITENGIVLYREATKIFEDDVEVTRKYHRALITPGQDITDQPKNVQNICNVVWTPEVVAAYQASQAQAPGA